MWSKMEGKRKENSHPSHRINQQLFCHLPNTGASPPALEKFPSKSVTGKVQTAAELLLTPAGESET